MTPRAAILGVGQTAFGKRPETRPEDMVHEAVRAAVADAGIGFDAIEAVFAGSVQMHGGVGQRCVKELGLLGIPIVNVENACSSGSTALREAYAWVSAGFADVALAFGVENLSRSLAATAGRLVLDDIDEPLGSGMGMVLPGLYALEATQYLHEHKAPAEAIARVSVKNRYNAARNPHAHQRKEVTLAEVMASKMICEPLTLLECCPNSDGAAAVIIASEAAARRFKHPGNVWLAASAMGSGHFIDRISQAGHVTQRVAAQAYKRAGIVPGDVDLVELHDAFAIAELLYIEQLGLAPVGTAWKGMLDGAFELGGKVAVSPGGGLIGRGHPMGATGIAQACEVTWQLRGEAGARQVADARIALTHTMGGNQFDLESNACIVSVFTRG